MPRMEAKKKTGMFDQRSMQLGSVDEEQESISILNSEADAGTENRQTQQPIKLVEEPKIFRDKKGMEMVHDAKRLNSMKRPKDHVN